MRLSPRFAGTLPSITAGRPCRQPAYPNRPRCSRMKAPEERESMRLQRFRSLCLLAGLAVSGALVCAAQDSQSQPQTQQQQQQDNSDQDSLQTFKAEVNVVNLFFNVKDKHGMLIPNLTKDDF